MNPRRISVRVKAFVAILVLAPVGSLQTAECIKRWTMQNNTNQEMLINYSWSGTFPGEGET
jgi:hypothetical protein